MITYTIVNICPKKTFYFEKDLEKYCKTHVVPVGYDDFNIEKCIIENINMPGKKIDTSIDTELVIDLCNKIADKLSNIPEHFMTGWISDYLTASNNKILIEILKNIKPEHIVECLDVHTNYKPCNNFAIHIDTHTKQTEKLKKEYIVKYNKEHNTSYSDLVCTPVWTTTRERCREVNWDLTKLTKDEVEFFETLYKPTSFFIQFRDDNIMIDNSYYTGRHVSHRQNNPIGFDKSRYNWCVNCINGIFDIK